MTKIFKTKTFTNLGLQGYEITVEADANNALPSIEIIWLPDAAVRESKERLRATFRHVHITLPKHKIILNLSPSDTKKVGTSLDLAMAIAILILINEGKVHHQDQIENFIFFWELGLDGNIKRVNGLLPSVINAIKHGYKHFFIPAENMHELEYVHDINVYPLDNFQQVVEYFLENKEIPIITEAKNIHNLIINREYETDFEHIKGQLLAKRALSIAAAGLHNLLMVGWPGCGKTLLSKALHSILPPLTFEEILEVSQIYSVVGKLTKQQPLITQRPFRQIHHTASKISIVGWWSQLTPGEVSLAHKWILFFDELTEFPRETLEVLRQPIEDKTIVISRVAGTIQYPASFMFVASMNPCKCGYYKDPVKPCICSLFDIKKYQNKISWPLLDRIDMILEIPRENVDKILDTIPQESSEEIRQKVLSARKIQQRRFANSTVIPAWGVGTGISLHHSQIFSNSQITSKDIDKLIPLDTQTKDFLKDAARKLSLSPRVIHRTIKLARTIADMEWIENVGIIHLAEALQYRNKTMFVDKE